MTTSVEYQIVNTIANLAHKLAKQHQKDIRTTTGERITVQAAALLLQQENVDYNKLIHNHLSKISGAHH